MLWGKNPIISPRLFKIVAKNVRVNKHGEYEKINKRKPLLMKSIPQ